jgi:uncharacterized protein YdaU (DUF1376 family)
VNYYERHIGDYLKDTSHLSLLEHGIYTRLLDVYYTRECGIDAADVARLIGARSKDEKAALAVVLSDFFVLESGVYVQARCDREIARYQKKAAHNREVGKLGGRPRKSETQEVPKPEPTNNPGGFQTEPTNNPPQYPVTSNQTNTEIQAPTVLVGKASPPRPPDCPTDELLKLYHEHLPMLPRVEVVNDGRRRTLSARWREVVTDPDIRKASDPRAAAIDWFAWFFGHAARSTFLTGKCKDWRADFDFLMTPQKFAKVVEGSYHKEHA